MMEGWQVTAEDESGEDGGDIRTGWSLWCRTEKLSRERYIRGFAAGSGRRGNGGLMATRPDKTLNRKQCKCWKRDVSFYKEGPAGTKNMGDVERLEVVFVLRGKERGNGKGAVSLP